MEKSLTKPSIELRHPSLSPDIPTTAPMVLAGRSYSSCILMLKCDTLYYT